VQNKTLFLKSWLWLILLLSFPFVVQSQTTDFSKDMGFGVKSGVSFSSLVVSIPLQSEKGFFEPTYGLIFSYIDKKIVGIQLEVNYVTKTWEENPIVDYRFTSKLNYIEIPMFTTLHFGNKLKFLVNFGPYLAILLKEQTSHNIAEASDYFPYYENRIARKGDFGMLGGAGIRYRSKFGLLQAEARYTYGFQNLYDSTTTKLDYSNLQTFGFFLSYQFSIINGR
jgi:hypothetical protein